MYYMGRDIRMAGLDPTGKAKAGIIENLPNQIRFTEDIWGQDGDGPPDGDTGDKMEDITYLLEDKDGDGDTDLVRNTGNGNLLIAENIKSLIFKYWDGTGETEATPPAIRFVDIILKAVSDDGSSDRTMTARIHCRNLGY
jgi:type IV pilus assembly protein PilW